MKGNPLRYAVPAAVCLGLTVGIGGEDRPARKFDAVDWKGLELVNDAVEYGQEFVMSESYTAEERERAIKHLRNTLRHIEAFLPPEPAAAGRPKRGGVLPGVKLSHPAGEVPSASNGVDTTKAAGEDFGRSSEGR